MGLNGWDSSKKLKLIIDSSKVDEDLTNFPVNITLSSGTGQTGFDTTAVFDELVTVSGTKKIAITTTISGVETELYTEIERWDWSNEKANLWVKIPTVSSGTNTELFLYYDSDHADNTNYIGDTGDTPAQNVWNSSFKAVYHMAQDPSSGSGAIKDSTSNTNHGTSGGGMASDDLVNGKIGKAIDFDGSDDRIVISDDVGLRGMNALTIEIILNVDSKDNYEKILDYSSAVSGNADRKYRLQFDAEVNHGIVFVLWDSANVVIGNATITEFPLTDCYIAGVYTGANAVDSVKIYKNASTSVDASGTGNDVSNVSAGNVWLGGEQYSAPSSPYDGKEDEVRISNTARSAAWIKATYHSNWNDFVTFGEVVEFVFMNPIPAHLSTAYGITKQLYLTTTISGPASEYIYDADFFDSFDVQIGTTVSGINSGSQAVSNVYLSTPSGIDYSWYMTASSSGVEDTSQTYTFHNRFLASGTTEVNGVLTSGIDVRLYLRDTGELLGSTISTISGVFNIETQYNAEFYCVALSPYTDTNSLIYDFLEAA